MARILPDRMSADIDGDFVVFLIGMRINKPWKIHRWWPVFMGMSRMLKELEKAGPETGFLGHNFLGLTAAAPRGTGRRSGGGSPASHR